MNKAMAHFLGSAIAIAILCCAGCSSPVTWVEDKGTDRNELVKVSADWEPKYKVYIIKVDDKSLPCSDLAGRTQTAYVKPGPHTLVVGYEHAINSAGPYGGGASRSFQKLRFTAQPGKSYAIHRKLDGYNITFWIDELPH